MKTLNIGIMAHVDAGKTTTAEQMLFCGGVIKTPGSVDKGSTQTDWLGIERERGISVRTSSASLVHDGMQIRIIDTPGHMDFTGEVERALMALDAAVLLVSAPDGVEPQTEKFWRGIAALGLPCVFFVNKADRVGVDIETAIREIRQRLTPRILCLSDFSDAGSGAFCSAARPLSALSEDETLELLEEDEAQALRFLEGARPSADEIAAVLRRRVTAASLYPVIVGSSMLGQGIDQILDCLSRCCEPPKRCDDGAACGFVYKVEHDPRMGKAAHVRMYGGTLRNRDAVILRRPGNAADTTYEEKITQIRAVSGSQKKDTGVLVCGDAAAVYGLTAARAGDVLGDRSRLPERFARLPRLAVPMLSVRIEGPDARQNDLTEAIAELCDEDPSLDYDWNAEERELSVKIMGRIQLEVLHYLLAERYDLDVSFSKPLVLYRETPAASGAGYEEYTLPKPCWAVVRLQIDPLPRGAGYVFESRVKDSDIFYRYQNHIALSVPETLQQGLCGWPVTDLKVTLIGGSHHVQHTHNMDFFLATPIAVMDGLRNCGTNLLEPILKMRLTADETLAGKLIGDILSMRGETGNPAIKDGNVHIEALVPAATSLDYPTAFASLTSGRGRMASEFHSYRECPLELGATTKRRGVDPLDRAKWILFKRGAVA